ncbi:hypothetical protein QFC22_002940 [Naganishia vaughanmartiniae]|uniref:Uncharacterized protein n=1 Tax=Naganishia vaughanmartiniae TaxID=1424756 RepID=A0ACC2X8D2_9TREE|nr:hypothetical protein QFC22_002940 [Naganishia vaughanmartiniae]
MTTVTASTPITIRPARDDEYSEVARLHFSALITNPMFELLTSKVDKLAWFKYSTEQFKQGVDSDFSSLFVAQRVDTGNLVGLAWTIMYSKDHLPKLPSGPFPEGYNRKELALMVAPEYQLKEEALAKYGDVMYVAKMAVSPDIQGQGIGRRLMEDIKSRATQNGMNIILNAVSGASGFYEKLGFKVVGKPVMLADGTIEGPTPMVLVLSNEPEQSAV